MQNEIHRYSSDVLTPHMKAMMWQEKNLIPPQISLKDLIGAHERSLDLVQSPEKIVTGFYRLRQFAGDVFNRINTDFPNTITGGFFEGLPFCLVPQAESVYEISQLVIPKLVQFQQERLDRFRTAASEHINHPWVCIPCFSQQEFNQSNYPDTAYLNTYCGSCPKRIDEPLKPKDAKFSLVDYDIIFATNGQLPKEARETIWGIALAHNFAPIYQHLDRVMSGEMDPLDIWLFDQDEIYKALDQLATRRDWYNQTARPYDLFRYGATPIGPDNHPDIPFAPDALLQFQPFGGSGFKTNFFSRMYQLVGQPYFVGDMTSIITGEFIPDATAWSGSRMWSNQFLMEGDLHPLEAIRMASFRK